MQYSDFIGHLHARFIPLYIGIKLNWYKIGFYYNITENVFETIIYQKRSDVTHEDGTVYVPRKGAEFTRIYIINRIIGHSSEILYSNMVFMEKNCFQFWWYHSF